MKTKLDLLKEMYADTKEELIFKKNIPLFDRGPEKITQLETAEELQEFFIMCQSLPTSSEEIGEK